MDNRVLDYIKNAAIENKSKFGKVSENAVFGRVMGYLKSVGHTYSIEEIKSLVHEICEEVDTTYNTSTPHTSRLEERHKKVDQEMSLDSLLLALKELEGVKGLIRTRFEPSPSGPLHIGHLLPLVLNYAYAKKYKGEFILRIADTNPQNILPQAYDMIVEDVEWITGESIEDIKYYVQSERMQIYYDIAEELIKQGAAYVCTCDNEKFKHLLSKGIPCPHREQSVEKNLNEWEKMFDVYKSGEAVLRIKTDIKHDNPAVRDWPAFRIVEEEHPLQKNKYRVWPLMNFSVSVDDHLMGITHVIRGKDHIVNAERQAYLFGYMKWPMPNYIHIGRLNFNDLKLSTSQTKREIEAGKYSGWDDVRLPFLRSFRKRGYTPKAFVYYILSMGLSLRDKKTSMREFMKNINKINRQIIDKNANRYFFIKQGVEIKLLNIDRDYFVELPLHPDFKERGSRIIKISKDHPYIFIEKKDYDSIRLGEEVRLKHLFNVIKRKEGFEISFNSGKNEYIKKTRIIHYLPAPSSENILTRVYMPDGEVIEGMAERNVVGEREGNRVQFERFGFVKIDKIDKLYKYLEVYYIHE